ncbi:AAA family ATPase [Shimazuella soli]|uniref:AAA family ATPase n=1 Tax=Shimazuella soli TaxID=1892854 RepID=UPI0030B81CC0
MSAIICNIISILTFKRRTTIIKSHIGKRIWIIGTSGTGKTTLAKIICQSLNLTHYELDEYFWGPEWTKLDEGEFLDKISRICTLEQWVIDGLYMQAKDIITNQVDTIIWLDFKIQLILYRIIVRTFKNLINRKQLWNGNRENIIHIFSDFIPFIIRTYRKNRKSNTELFKKLNERVCCIRIETVNEFNSLINTLNNESKQN